MFETALILREIHSRRRLRRDRLFRRRGLHLCLRIPFVGVLISHAAMAGAILAEFLHVRSFPRPWERRSCPYLSRVPWRTGRTWT
jgi:hypothetical protein